MAIGGIPDAHDTDLYTIYKGILYLSNYVSGQDPSWSDLGNCTNMELELTEEKLEHYSSRSGIRKKDKEIVIESGYNLSFTLDEFSVANMALFLKANTSHNVIYGNTNFTGEYSLKFESDNPVGPNQRWIFHRCSISPNGTLQLIGEDTWAEMAFTASGLDDSDNNATSPYFNVTAVTTTSSTTTTTTA